MIVKGFVFFSCCFSLVPLFSSGCIFKAVRLGDTGSKLNLGMHSKMVTGSKFLH